MWLREGALTHVLNTQWNPYKDPPHYLARYPYDKTGARLTWYIFWNNPSAEELSAEILKFERDAKLRPNRERAKRVAEELLREYHATGVF